MSEVDYTSDDALGLRVADCGCCYIVDKVALDALGAEYVRLRRAIEERADGYGHAGQVDVANALTEALTP